MAPKTRRCCPKVARERKIVPTWGQLEAQEAPRAKKNISLGILDGIREPLPILRKERHAGPQKSKQLKQALTYEVTSNHDLTRVWGWEPPRIVYASRIPPRPLGDWKLGSSDAKRIVRAAGIMTRLHVILRSWSHPKPSQTVLETPQNRRPNRPRCAQDAPKRRPKGPKAPKRRPRAPKVRPRGVQEAPKSAQEASERPKCPPKPSRNDGQNAKKMMSKTKSFFYLFFYRFGLVLNTFFEGFVNQKRIAITKTSFHQNP